MKRLIKYTDFINEADSNDEIVKKQVAALTYSKLINRLISNITHAFKYATPEKKEQIKSVLDFLTEEDFDQIKNIGKFNPENIAIASSIVAKYSLSAEQLTNYNTKLVEFSNNIKKEYNDLYINRYNHLEDKIKFELQLIIDKIGQPKLIKGYLGTYGLDSLSPVPPTSNYDEYVFRWCFGIPIEIGHLRNYYKPNYNILSDIDYLTEKLAEYNIKTAVHIDGQIIEILNRCKL